MTRFAGVTGTYTDRIVLRLLLPNSKNQFGYYTLMNVNPVIAEWAYKRLSSQLERGEKISLWRHHEDTGPEELYYFERVT